MEKQAAKPKNKFLKLLPRAASSISFQNPPFSPNRDKRSDNYTNKIKAHVGRFSGPMIPDEARRKPKNESFEAQEPTSPKVSCMGQIKHKKKIKKAKRVTPPQVITKPVSSSPREAKKHVSKFKRIFSTGVKQGRSKSEVSSNKDPLPDQVPSLSQMKRFASGRDAFASFDWSAQIAPVESDHRNYYSDEERGDSDQEDDEPLVPFSAPMTVGGGVSLQPRKEVNLWKRRTMNPPRPLQLNSMVGAN